MQIIWITGGSSGIGLATAKKFLQNNWSVVISSSNLEKLNKAKEKISLSVNIENLHIVQCDISKKNEVEKVVDFIEKKNRP